MVLICNLPVYISPSLNIVQSIHHHVLPLKERIIVYLLLSAWEDLVFLSINVQLCKKAE